MMALIVALALSGPPMRDCARCHTPGGWRDVPAEVPFDHRETRFPLVGRHAAVRCNGCHGEGLHAADRTPTECLRCHTSPHAGELTRACESCHSPRGWKVETAVLDHRTTRFPLVGAHVAADCASCHPRMREGLFRGPRTECFACHAAEWRRGDVHPNHAAAGFSTTCDLCHTQLTWEMPRLRHELFFPLQGAHLTAQCTDCHQGGRFGGTPTACVGCHRGEYDRATEPLHRANRMSTACDQCHAPTSWHVLSGGWHQASFPIDGGPHGGFACGNCHVRQGSYIDFSCTVCHQRGHEDVPGYAWESFACFNCHPRGRAE